MPSGLSDDAGAWLKAMTDAIAHRGPDDQGLWLDAMAGVALGHRRLSIVDLSPAGHQPMVSDSGRYAIVYNGEIYNHHDLRAELEAAGTAPAWRGHSDTEVLLAAIDHWGLDQSLTRLNGMFAFALWDRETRSLSLARDRLGEKPLYYGNSGGVFLFGSELKALTTHPAFSGSVDRDALTLFLRHSYVPACHSIWQGINKLPPAHYVVVKRGGRDIGVPVCYWDFDNVAQTSAAAAVADGPHLADELEKLLADAVSLRMEADVPLGAFLSGGIDSSIIVALMQAQSARPVRTFSIGSREQPVDEAVYAKAVAAHLGTDHTEFYVTSQDALAVVSRLPSMWDEPFADESQIPTYLVSRMAREHVTVSLTGDGGDELFGGYRRYFKAMKVWRWISAVPLSVRPAVGRLVRGPVMQSAGRLVDRCLPGYARRMAAVDRLTMTAELLESGSREALYRRLMSFWASPEEVVLNGREPATLFSQQGSAFADFRQTMMYLDTLTYLPGDILAKVDRASMAVGLETRVPFLDHRLVEFAWRLPMTAKMKGGTGKRILREVLYRHLPRPLIDRPKTGFGAPIGAWLSGPLRGWAEDLLNERRLRADGFFDPAPIRRLWEEHKAGRWRRYHRLWSILMFQAWWQEQRQPLAVRKPILAKKDRGLGRVTT